MFSDLRQRALPRPCRRSRAASLVRTPCRPCRRSRTACPRAVPGPSALSPVGCRPAPVRPRGRNCVAGLRFRLRNPVPCFPELLCPAPPPRLPQAVSRTVYRNARREGQSQIGSRSFVFAGAETSRNPGDPLGDHFDHLAALRAPVVCPPRCLRVRLTAVCGLSRPGSSRPRFPPRRLRPRRPDRGAG